MKPASAPRYDLFKLIVALVLVAILILMLLRGCATVPVTGIPPVAVTASPPATDAPVIEKTNETSTPLPVPPTKQPTPTPTTVLPSPSAAPPTAEPTANVPTATSPAPPQGTGCDTSVPSRLAVGQKAQVVQRLNMRNAASIQAPIIQTNPVKTSVQIIGGPVCTPVGSKAYLWWQIQLADGSEGWSAESTLNQASYLLEPAP